MDSNSETTDPPRLYTVAAFAERHRSWLTQSALRAHILNSVPRRNSRGEENAGNGLAESGAILRLGRRLYIDEARWFGWLAQQQGRAARSKASR